MFDKLRDRSSPWVVWPVRIVLTLIALTFGVWGIESYFTRSAITDAAATVDGSKITQKEFNDSLRMQQESLRQRNEGSVDASIFRSPAFKQSVLDSIIGRRLLLRDARKAGLVISDEQLVQRIQALPAFQVDGKFSRQVYESAARNRGYGEAGFDELLREDLIVSDYYNSVAGSAIVSNTALDRFIKLSDQKREVSVATIKPEQFAAQVKIDPAQAKKYYDANLAEFGIPEQAKIEYLIYSAEQFAKKIEVTPAEIEAAYKERAQEFTQKEERQASHILIAAAADASAADKSAAKKKAETVLAQAKANPGKFGELAKQYSQDPGSAVDGGKLEFINEDGQLVAPFKDAMFKMTKGEIAGPVETEFGYHVIKLDDIRPKRGKTLAEVSEALKNQIQKQKAGRQFAANAEQFGDLVYDQATGLKGAAEKLGLELKQSDWISKDGANQEPPLNHPKLLAAIFSNSVLKDKRTTEPVEVAPNVLVAARVIESRAAATKPFDSVSAAITAKLTRVETTKLAKKAGEEALTQLKAGREPAGLSWSAPSVVSRQEFGQISPALMKSVYGVDTQKIPSYAGQEAEDGSYALVKISKVIDVEKIDDARRAAAVGQMQQLYGSAVESSVLASLRARAKIKISAEALAEPVEQ